MAKEPVFAPFLCRGRLRLSLLMILYHIQKKVLKSQWAAASGLGREAISMGNCWLYQREKK